MPGINWLSENCKKSSKVISIKTYRNAIGNITKEEIEALPKVERSEKNILDGLVFPAAHNWLVVHRSVSMYDENRAFNNRIRYYLSTILFSLRSLSTTLA